jgi:predicted O-methyltransferase YrrM
MTTALPTARGGTAYDRIDEALRGFAQYDEFRHGQIGRADYCAWVRAHLGFLADLGLNEDQANLSTRFPHDERGFVAEILADLAEAGVLDAVDYPEEEFTELRRRVGARWAHDGRSTYIFPEEARLLFALAHLTRPRHAVFLGSYYGYWAVWALPAVLAAGGRATLVDIDPAVMELAERNLTALGLAGRVDFRVADAISYPGGGLHDVDLCVLDAEGPRDAPEEDLRDKAIYFPITAAVTPAMAPGGLLVAHNMLLRNLTRNPYFAGRIARNLEQYAKFHRHLERHYGVRREYPTTEGVGIYRHDPAGPVAAWGMDAPCAA